MRTCWSLPQGYSTIFTISKRFTHTTRLQAHLGTPQPVCSLAVGLVQCRDSRCIAHLTSTSLLLLLTVTREALDTATWTWASATRTAGHMARCVCGVVWCVCVCVCVCVSTCERERVFKCWTAVRKHKRELNVHCLILDIPLPLLNTFSHH